MGCLAQGYPAARVPQDDKASVMGPSQEIQFWGWESFPEPSIPLEPMSPQGAVQFMLQAERCLAWHLDAKFSCPLCCTAVRISPSHGQKEPGFWLA